MPLLQLYKYVSPVWHYQRHSLPETQISDEGGIRRRERAEVWRYPPRVAWGRTSREFVYMRRIGSPPQSERTSLLPFPSLFSSLSSSTLSPQLSAGPEAPSSVGTEPQCTQLMAIVKRPPPHPQPRAVFCTWIIHRSTVWRQRGTVSGVCLVFSFAHGSSSSFARKVTHFTRCVFGVANNCFITKHTGSLKNKSASVHPTQTVRTTNYWYRPLDLPSTINTWWGKVHLQMHRLIYNDHCGVIFSSPCRNQPYSTFAKALLTTRTVFHDSSCLMLLIWIPAWFSSLLVLNCGTDQPCFPTRSVVDIDERKVMNCQVSKNLG